MTMHINRLATYWTAEEADTVIAFLDELRDMLWEAYGEQIIEMRREAETREYPPNLPLGDNGEF